MIKTRGRTFDSSAKAEELTIENVKTTRRDQWDFIGDEIEIERVQRVLYTSSWIKISKRGAGQAPTLQNRFIV